MDSTRFFFLRQSYMDSYTYYRQSLSGRDMPRWDYLILTASNETQAEAYRQQIDYRLRRGLLPSRTHYAVLPDPDGKRVGSGGATLNVLKYVRQREGYANCFKGKRILVIHSGGDSKRVPQYSACGKLFSPVPRELPDGRHSSLFDEFVISMSAVPARMKDGMLVLSGDVLLLFNPLQIDFSFSGAAALSIKEPVETGKNHGVFLPGKNGYVSRFLHKQTVENLQHVGAVDESGAVDLDTGAILMDSTVLESMFSLISENGQVSPDKFASCVNEQVRLSFYGDFLYPLAQDATLEEYYREKPEGEPSEALTQMRTQVWETLHSFRLKLINLSPAAFLHFGTTRELLELMAEKIDEYRHLDWQKKVCVNDMDGNYAASNSLIREGADIGKGCYIEDSEVGSEAVIGEGCVLSGVTVLSGHVPAHTVLSGLRLTDGRFVVRAYGVTDNPKEDTFLGCPLSEYMQNNSLSRDTLWSAQVAPSLWDARLYPVCDSITDAVDKTLSSLTHYDSQLAHMSLSESYRAADSLANLNWQENLTERIYVEKIIDSILRREDIREAAGEMIRRHPLTLRQRKWLVERAKQAPYSEGIRIYYALSVLCKSDELLALDYEQRAFQLLSDAIFEDSVRTLAYNEQLKIALPEVVVRLPLRVNWGGGWSDTPPYCNEQGGTVLNAAISVRGELPVEVRVTRLDQPVLRFASEDSGALGEFTDIETVLDCSNPYDSFALHKAALVACGVLPRKSQQSLEEILTRLGGGICLSTQVRDIPRGSGLGTSSILSGACVMALYEFFGIDSTPDEQYTRVMCMEQIMSTGGGWQDQLGGMAPGIKLITSPAGISQTLSVENVALPRETMDELEKRFCIIYTGQRRLARNLLREVMGKYISSNPDVVSVLNEIQHLAVLMRYELMRGKVDEFAHLLNQHWELSKRLDAGCTNTCIDYIFMVCEDLIEGRMICGAGGGGFLQVILKKGVTREELRTRLRSTFQMSGVDVWDSSFHF